MGGAAAVLLSMQAPRAFGLGVEESNAGNPFVGAISGWGVSQGADGFISQLVITVPLPKPAGEIFFCTHGAGCAQCCNIYPLANLACAEVRPPRGLLTIRNGRSVFFGGAWVLDQSTIPGHFGWLAVKVVDAGESGGDRMALKYFPSITAHDTSEPAPENCGAAALVTQPIVGDFVVSR